MSLFGTVPPTVSTQYSLDGLAPRFRVQVLAILGDMLREGHDPLIVESMRSDDRQRFLYGFGRDYDDGRGIVTNSAEGKNSWHFYGLAVDVVSRSRLWKAPPEFWSALGASAARRELTWGGNWPNFPDKPHVQFPSRGLSSPTSHIIELYDSGGLVSVWTELSAL
ncbi:MAG: hypothetical protein JWM95_2735 [Gemmatimonadetes bacterium]|nr:hypothetical protein [Gemmatimonadota bacterium]